MGRAEKKEALERGDYEEPTKPLNDDEVAEALAKRNALINPDLKPPPAKFVKQKRCFGLCTKTVVVVPAPFPTPTPPSIDSKGTDSDDGEHVDDKLEPNSPEGRKKKKEKKKKKKSAAKSTPVTLEQHLDARTGSHRRLQDARKRFGPHSPEYWQCLSDHHALDTPRDALLSQKKP